MWCKKLKTSGKWKAKMVNTAFAWQSTWGCKFEVKCSIYYFFPWFNRGVHFFCTKLVKSKFGSNQIFRAVFAASGSEGLQVLFSGAGFVCCQGSPLHWPVSSPLCGSQTGQQSCWSSYWKWRRQHCWSFPINRHTLPLCAPGKDSSSAHANSSTLPCWRDLLMSKRGLPSFFVWYSYFDGNFTLLHTKEGVVSHSALR